MIIFPAIDLKDGRCVRLREGDFATAHQVADTPQAAAQAFIDQGARWLHVVDLDGAKEGRVVNGGIVLALAQAFDADIQVGGGIRDMETVEAYLTGGVSRVILGSAALEDPDFVKQAVSRYGGKIAVGIDARDGLVAAGGWLQTSRVHYLDLAAAMEAIGVQYIILTDIAKDGMLSGPNLEQLELLSQKVSCSLIASGGIRDMTHINALCALGLYGAICGKSLYAGTLDLREAIEIGGNS